jgi:hypothetical protein
LTDSHSVSTPVNWRTGQEVIIIPSVSDADAQARFPRGWRAVRPYLRLTPDPRGPAVPAVTQFDLDASG